MKSYYEQAIRKYFKLCAIWGCVLVLIWLISFVWVRGLAAILLLFVILLASKMAVSVVAKKNIINCFI